MYALNRCGRVQRGLKQERTDCSRETRLLWPWRPGPQGGEDSINRIVCVCLYHKCSGRFPMSVLCESRTFRSSVRSRSVLTQRVTFLYCVSMKLKFQSRFYLLQKHTVVIKATFPGIFCNCWDKKKNLWIYYMPKRSTVRRISNTVPTWCGFGKSTTEENCPNQQTIKERLFFEGDKSLEETIK